MELSPQIQDNKVVIKKPVKIDDVSLVMTKYEDVKDITTEEYFHNNAFSIDAFKLKYTNSENETYVQALKRVCDYIASCEATEELQRYWSARWFDEVYNDWWAPAGSIMQGAASTRKISLMNCTTLPFKEDTIESIFETAKNVAKCAAFRQGLGADFSVLRPRGSAVNNSSKISYGAVHWMEFIDSISYRVGQSGRLPAQLFSIQCNHPDVIEFINVKSDKTKIQNANISVQITEDFYSAVENDTDWVLQFVVRDTGEKISKIIRAHDLLEQIAKNMHTHAEPGVQNIDVMHKYSNSDAIGFPIISTNACSEEALDSGGCCCLSSINCDQFSTHKEERSKELEKIGVSICRFLDNVVEMEMRDKRYPTNEHYKSLEGIRRIGAGITNICGYLFKNNLSYGTLDGNKAIEELVEEYRYNLYKASIALGKEKGSFRAFDRAKFETALNVQKMMKKGLEFSHMRNVETCCIAPSGCTVKETKIITNNGIKTIEAIFNENSISLNEIPSDTKQWFEPTKKIYVRDINNNMNLITKLYYNGYENTIKLLFDDDEQFIATQNHKILVKDADNNEYGIWKRLDELTTNDEVIFIQNM